MIPDLEDFKEVDPDKLYVNYDIDHPVLTFFYNTIFHTATYSDTHEDLILKKETFYDTFPAAVGLIKSFQINDLMGYDKWDGQKMWLDNKLAEMQINPKSWKATVGKRGKCINFGFSLLGRIAIFEKDLVISLWQKKNHSRFLPFIHDLKVIEKIKNMFGRKFPISDWIVVPFEQSPFLFSSIIDLEKISVPETMQEPSELGLMKRSLRSKYTIGGVTIGIENLLQLRGMIHSSPSQSKAYAMAISVLCHDDMKKYPELLGFIPANKCSKPEKMAMNPNLVKSRELYRFLASNGEKPDTGLLYPSWRSHSEHTLSFADWFKEIN